MQLQTLPLSQLNPAPYNPRVPLEPGSDGYEKLARSMEEFHLVQPLVWNERTGHVVGGHQRLQVLKDRGEESAPCVVVDMEEDREKALNIALNNSAVGSEWEIPKLLELLEELNTSSLDATLTGFTADDLKGLLITPDCHFLPMEEPTPLDVEVCLDVPVRRWPAVRSWVESLLAEEASVRAHIDDLAVRAATEDEEPEHD